MAIQAGRGAGRGIRAGDHVEARHTPEGLVLRQRLECVTRAACAPCSLGLPTSSMMPLKPRYHGFMGSGCSPSSMRRRLATMSRGSKLGMEVDQPVPMPSAPLTSTVGSSGMYLRQGRRCPVRAHREGCMQLQAGECCHAAPCHRAVRPNLPRAHQSGSMLCPSSFRYASRRSSCALNRWRVSGAKRVKM